MSNHLSHHDKFRMLMLFVSFSILGVSCNNSSTVGGESFRGENTSEQNQNQNQSNSDTQINVAKLILKPEKKNYSTDELLNLIDLSNKETQENLEIIGELENRGEGLKAKIAKMYFANESNSDNEILLSEEEILTLKRTDDLESQSFKFMCDKVMEKIIQARIIEANHTLSTEELDQEQLLAQLNEESELVKKIIEMGTDGTYYKTYKNLSINQIVENESQIIKQHSLKDSVLTVPKFSGYYSVNADGQSNSYSFQDVDILKSGDSRYRTYSYGTTSYSSSNVSIDSRKNRIFPHNDGTFSFSNLGDTKNLGNIEERKSFNFHERDNFILSYESFNIGLSVDFKVHGGYSCQKGPGGIGRKNCRNHTATSVAQIKGNITLPRCENIYSCLPVVEVMPEARNTLSMSIPSNGNTILLLSDDRDIQINFNRSLSHTGIANPISQASSAKIQLWHPLTFVPHNFDYLFKSQIVLNLIKNNIAYANVIADMLQRAKKRTHSFPALKNEEEILLYSVLKTVRNSNYEHIDETEIIFEMIEKSIMNRLIELNFNALKNDVYDVVEDYNEAVLSYHRVVGILNEFLNQEVVSDFEKQFLMKTLLDAGLEKISRINFDDKKNLKIIVEQFTIQEKNRLFIKRKKIENKIEEFKLYAGSEESLDSVELL